MERDLWDRIERLVGREADGALDAEGRDALDRLSARHPEEVERARAELRELRRRLRLDELPPPPADLKRRILARAAEARGAEAERMNVLPFVRRLAAAAALVLAAAAWPLLDDGGVVRGGEDQKLRRRFVEDRLRPSDSGRQPDLVRFLRERLLGRGEEER